MEKTTFVKHPTCYDCRFMDKLVEEGGEHVTICRRKPPVVAYAFMQTGKGGGGQVLQQSLFPIMRNGDWCGDLETRTN